MRADDGAVLHGHIKRRGDDGMYYVSLAITLDKGYEVREQSDVGSAEFAALSDVKLWAQRFAAERGFAQITWGDDSF